MNQKSAPAVTKLDFSLAYEYAEVAHRVIKYPDEVDILRDETYKFVANDAADFYKLISKPQKWTLLHNFIYNLNLQGAVYETSHSDPEYLIERYREPILSAGIELPPWFTESEIGEYASELDELLIPVIREATEATFQILFMDRKFLYEFQIYVTPIVQSILKIDSGVMKADGVVKRTGYINQWLKHAVFHRDKGRCQLCFTDITGLFVPSNDRHMDHMVSLNQSGTNDPTNFQLLCTSCNTSKGAKTVFSNPAHYKFW